MSQSNQLTFQPVSSDPDVERWYIDQLKLSLQYLRMIKERGYRVSAEEMAQLEHEIISRLEQLV